MTLASCSSNRPVHQQRFLSGGGIFRPAQKFCSTTKEHNFLHCFRTIQYSRRFITRVPFSFILVNHSCAELWDGNANLPRDSNGDVAACGAQGADRATTRWAAFVCQPTAKRTEPGGGRLPRHRFLFPLPRCRCRCHLPSTETERSSPVPVAAAQVREFISRNALKTS
jgi:hypothetical protein